MGIAHKQTNKWTDEWMDRSELLDSILTSAMDQQTYAMKIKNDILYNRVIIVSINILIYICKIKHTLRIVFNDLDS